MSHCKRLKLFFYLMVCVMIGVIVCRYMLTGHNSHAFIIRIPSTLREDLLPERNNEYNRQVSSNVLLWQFHDNGLGGMKMMN